MKFNQEQRDQLEVIDRWEKIFNGILKIAIALVLIYVLGHITWFLGR